MEGIPALPRRLRLLNLIRWARAHWFSWTLLGLAYSAAATVLIGGVAEAMTGAAPPWVPLWGAISLVLLAPAFLEKLPLGGIPFVRRLAFGESPVLRATGPLGPLYLRHELRRGATWAGVGLTAAIGATAAEVAPALWVIAALLPSQRALYSIHRWRSLAVSLRPASGAGSLLRAFLAAQLVQIFVAWAAVGVASLPPLAVFLRMGAGALGATLASGAMALEGDSGRPWLVNLASASAGLVVGFLCFLWPVVLVPAGYFAARMVPAVASRLRSVEHFHEDLVLP